MTDEPLSEAERAELERLRADASTRGKRRWPRWSAAVVTMVLAALLAVLTLVVVVARDGLLDTQRYVDTVAPLAADPHVRDAVADRISDTVIERLDLEDMVSSAVDSIQTRGAPDVLDSLAGPIAAAVDGFVTDQVDAIVHSEQFTQLWTNMNRAAHSELAALLRGGDGEALSIEDGMLYLDLRPVVAEVKDRLVARGLAVAAKLPAVSVSFPLMDVSGLVKLRGVANLLDTLAWVLPLTAAVLLAFGVYLAPDRRRGLITAAVALGLGMALVLAAVAVGRAVVLSGLPEGVRSPEAVAAVYDIVLRFLRAGARTVLVLAVLTVLAAWLLGPGRGATVLRGGLNRFADATATGLDRVGAPLGPVPGFVSRNRRALEVAVLALALLWLVLWQHRGVAGLLWIAAAALLAVAVIEVLGRVPGSPEARNRRGGGEVMTRTERGRD